MKALKNLLALVLVLGLALVLCACGGETTDPQGDDDVVTTTTVEKTTTTTAPEASAASFQVTVVDQNGTPVPNVMLQVCKDTCVPAKTDDNGVATFSVEITDGYKLSVLSCPAGYTYGGEAEVYLDSGITEFTVEVQGEA